MTIVRTKRRDIGRDNSMRGVRLCVGYEIDHSQFVIDEIFEVR